MFFKFHIYGFISKIKIPKIKNSPMSFRNATFLQANIYLKKMFQCCPVTWFMYFKFMCYTFAKICNYFSSKLIFEVYIFEDILIFMKKILVSISSLLSAFSWPPRDGEDLYAVNRKSHSSSLCFFFFFFPEFSFLSPLQLHLLAPSSCE